MINEFKPIEINLFDKFGLKIENREIFLPKRSRELLALIAVLGGGNVTAKRHFEIIEKPNNKKYNANSFLSSYGVLVKSLKSYGDIDFLEAGMLPIRFWRIIRCKVDCDYYDMLDGKTPIRQKELFLPDYPWAAEMYCRSWFKVQELDKRLP